MIMLIGVVISINADYHAEISSFGDYDMLGKTFFILSGDSRISNNDLEFQYYRDIITQCMLRNKAIPTNNYDSADVCILLDYDITDESYVATRSIPIWGPTGISSITTTQTTTGNVSGYGSSYGSASAYKSGNSAYGYGSGSSYGNVSGSSTTRTTQNYNYNYGVTRYREKSYKVDIYRRVFNLYAYDNKIREGEPVMLWRTNVTSDGYKNDLQDVFPFMAQLALKYMGTNSNGKQRYYTLDNNPDALAMKQKYYLKNNVVVNPINYNADGNIDQIWIRSVQLDNNSCSIALLGRKVKNKTSLKFRGNTYIIYNGQRYSLESVYVPFQTYTTRDMNYVNKYIYFQEDVPMMMILRFPIKMHKGDSFDLVAYSNKKETKEIVSFKNIIIE